MKVSPSPFRFPVAAIATALALTFAASSPAAPSASLAVSPATIYLGESFTAEVRVTNLDGNSSPSASLALPRPAEVAGPAVAQQLRTSIINGRRTSESTTTLTFRVTPLEAGDFSVEGAEVHAGGRNVPCQGAAVVRVVGPEPSPYAEVSLSASRERVLVDEPFEVYADVVVRKLPPPFDSESPLLFTPAFSVPHLASPPAGEVESPDAAALLGALVARNGEAGVTINNVALQSNGPFGGGFPFGGMLSDPFERPRTATFALPREDTTLRGEPAWRYRLTARFTPRAEGDLSFAPAVLRGALATGVRDGNRAIATEVFCTSAPLVVHVAPPPSEGRPDTFCGTVGTSLEAVASLDAQTCRQGDPVRLTLDVSGTFSQRAFRAPALATRPGVKDVFRVYDEVKTEPGPSPGSLRLTYTLRPLRAGTLELPALDLAYYNTASNAYAVARTTPVPLRVAEVPAFDPDALFAAVEADTTDAAQSETGTDDLPPAILADAASVTVDSRRAWLPSPRLLALSLALPLLAAALALGRFLRRGAVARRAAARRRRAPNRATRALRRARTPSAALDAVRAFFRDAHGLSAAAFTPADALDISPPDVRPELAALLQPLYDQSFQAVPDVSSELSGAVRERLPALLRRTLPAEASGRYGLAPFFFGALGLARAALLLTAALSFACAVLPARNAADAPPETIPAADRFLWEQAGSLMAKAATPDDFLAAAHVYLRILSSHADRPGVWRNAGTALLLAEHPAEALDAFRRAEALGGSDPDLRHGIRAALRAQGRDLPWHRPLLAWLHAMPLRARATGAALAWCLLWLAQIAGGASRRLHATTRIIALAALVVFALLATGAIAAAHIG